MVNPGSAGAARSAFTVDRKKNLDAVAAGDATSDTERSGTVAEVQDAGAPASSSDVTLGAKELSVWTKPLPFQSHVKAVYTHNLCQMTVAGVIIGNFVVSICEKEFDPDGSLYADTWEALDNIFNSIFLVELLVNFYGSYFCAFWQSGWNLFDTLVVLVGVLTMSKAELGPFRDLKMLRAFRVFRLFKRIPSLNKIIVALVRAIPGVMNAFIIMLIVMCIYSILAVEYFRGFGDSDIYWTTEQNGVGDAATFTNVSVTSITMRGMRYGEEYYGTFSRALYTLFQVLTGESWAEMVARPLLFGRPEVDSPWSVFGVAAFFTSFILLHQIVLVNVVVAVLLDKFVESEPESQEDEKASGTLPGAGEQGAGTAAAGSVAHGEPLSDDPKALAQEVRQLRAEVAQQIAGMNEVRSQMERVLAMFAQQAELSQESEALSKGKARTLSATFPAPNPSALLQTS